MQRLEVSGAVRLIYGSLGVKRLILIDLNKTFVHKFIRMPLQATVLRFRSTKITEFNRLTSNDPYMGRTAPLTSKHYILYIYSTNIGTEYFKHALYSPFFSLQNSVCFIMLTCLVPVLFTFYIQDVLNLKKIIPAPKG